MGEKYLHDSCFILDSWHEGYFALPLIAEGNVGEMDDKTLGYFDDMTLLDVSIPS